MWIFKRKCLWNGKHFMTIISDLHCLVLQKLQEILRLHSGPLQASVSWTWFSQTGLRLKPWSIKFSNCPKTCNIAATCLRFCSKQQGISLLLGAKFQACSCNMTGLTWFEFIWIKAKVSIQFDKKGPLGAN